MKRKVAFVCLTILCILTCVSCGVDDIDVSEYGDSQIMLVGLSDKTESITVNQLKEMKCITKKTESTSDKIGEVRATGTLLSTLLESYGYDQEDFSKVIIYGEDEYDIKLDSEFLSENDIILAIGMNGEPLGKEDQPVRIIIPESDSAYWVRMVTKLEFIK